MSWTRTGFISRSVQFLLAGVAGWAALTSTRLQARPSYVDGSEQLRSEDKPATDTVAWLAENYVKFEHRIPMRDGIRLLTRVYVPKDDSTNYPIVLTRTPYALKPYGSDNFQKPGGSFESLAKDRFILVTQDVRGRFGSEGEYVHVRPFRPNKQGPADTDESSDTWDTIDWLVKNVPGNNGKVGMFGISYPGFYTAMGMIDSHPALKAASPQAPISDWFMGDDIHHNGALFRLNMTLCG
jgi:putative CocE/NonD family hydrolase